MNERVSDNPHQGLRIHTKYYRLIFTGLMALLMSLIISSALILLKQGYSQHFFSELMHSWGTSFIFAWPSAYVCAYVIQTKILTRIHFHNDD
ncbi:DUF2798 domain-containing protein [Psychrobacter sp. YP14]|jgi:hypothetical protein|uniref:DUF2798 domain-containing protein n=1 Tax=Psychrobacter TaxID=497 RepID=UPI000D7E8A4B|nr:MULTISPECIES: DUF2798 domain-containing protein [unclassified Psychrobacter]AWT48091.1 DUF2798 domain-containing protein [Psychrobacter sp. YP14]